MNRRADKLSPSTRRSYRAALQHFFTYELQTDSLENFYNFLKGTQSKKSIKEKFGKRTSAQKAKKMDPVVWTNLQQYLSLSKSLNAELALHLLQASVIFGLRPIEWHDAVIVENGSEKFVLRVFNAKKGQNRTHGIDRTLSIDLSSVNDDQVIDGIKSANFLCQFFEKHQTVFEDDHLGFDDGEALFKAYRDSVEEILKSVRDYLNQLFRTSRVFKKVPENKRITLYDARHQFAANAKKSGANEEEIAAIMGHGSILTAGKHYGRKCNGQSGFYLPLCQDSCRLVF